jgi:hypothetical protein
VLPAACRSARREVFLTYYDGAHGLSVSYPSAWRSEDASQGDVWHHHFLAPAPAGQSDPGVSVTLLAARLTAPLEDYAQSFLAGHTLASSKPEERQGVRGRSYVYASADGRQRNRLLLLEETGSGYGLHAQGPAQSFESLAPALDRIFDSLRLEREERYPVQQDARFGYALRLPESWRPGRSLSTGDRLVAQHMSPPLAADREGNTVHASLSVTVEPVGPPGTLDAYYQATRRLLGDSYRLQDHVRWRDGYADVMRTETPLTISGLKRFYRVADGRGYSLAFEARDDVFHGVAPWFDRIAGTLKVGPELLPSLSP